MSDGVLSAYIPLLGVLPAYQNQGIGKILVESLLKNGIVIHLFIFSFNNTERYIPNILKLKCFIYII
ncbi:GNAT family N-acetyltransferase [Shimazuella alba]|uniref:GNAT family N-acetyltransferase n=1 Tax=Shimazuella alba TaxID=2690964 RepID=UPI0030841379